MINSPTCISNGRSAVPANLARLIRKEAGLACCTSLTARLLRLSVVLSAFTLLTNCIESTKPILTDARPLFGNQARFQLYALRDGAAHDPVTATFVWRTDRYALTSGSEEGFGDFTIHHLEDPDWIVQSLRPGQPVEYAIARKLADGVYLVVAIDENDADRSTRDQLCDKEAGGSCRLSSRHALLTFARATAAKPRSDGGLAVLLADQ
jgi:hypothetical protein